MTFVPDPVPVMVTAPLWENVPDVDRTVGAAVAALVKNMSKKNVAARRPYELISLSPAYVYLLYAI